MFSGVPLRAKDNNGIRLLSEVDHEKIIHLGQIMKLETIPVVLTR